jgi:hypothetical protein
MSLFELFDQAIAEQLGVDIQTYVDTIDKFDDTEFEYIIETMLSPTAMQDDKNKVIELFKTKM